MSEDARCCGTGTCIINPEGVCWCGQVWDGEKMCLPSAFTYESLQKTENTVDRIGDGSGGAPDLPHQLD